MLTNLDDMPPGVLGVEASGKLKAEDYTQVLGPALAAATAEGRKLRVVLIFEDAFEGMDAGAVWQDLRTGVSAWHSWERRARWTIDRKVVDRGDPEAAERQRRRSTTHQDCLTVG